MASRDSFSFIMSFAARLPCGRLAVVGAVADEAAGFETEEDAVGPMPEEL